MKIVRTVVLVVLLAAILVFSMANWTSIEVKIWEGLVLETRLPVIVIIAFLLGLVPMWLLAKAGRWQLKRRIAALENAAQMATASLSSTHLSEVSRDTEANPDS